MFTAAQILHGAPLSVLNFFSPLGAGGAGATPRRVRAAYSRTRCLPHPKGWASAPMGRFCAALTYCSYYTFPRTLCLSALRAEVDSIYPARKSNALLCPCPEHFAERKPFGKSADWKSNALREGWVNCPASPRHPLRCCSEISRAELRSGTIAHKGANTAFFLSKVYGCHPPRRRATQALTRADTGFYIFGLQSSTQMGGHWRRTSGRKSAVYSQIF